MASKKKSLSIKNVEKKRTSWVYTAKKLAFLGTDVDFFRYAHKIFHNDDVSMSDQQEYLREWMLRQLRVWCKSKKGWAFDFYS